MGDSSDIDNDEEIEVTIKALDGEKFCISLSLKATILGLKMLIDDQQHIDAEQQHLIYRAQELNDNLSLSQYGISNGCIIHLVVLQNAQQNPNRVNRIDIMSVVRLNQFIRMFALIEAVFMLIYGLEAIYYFGAKYMKRKYLIVYSLCLILEISIRAYMAYLEYPNIINVALLILMIFINLFAAWCVYKLYRVIAILRPAQRERILLLNQSYC